MKHTSAFLSIFLLGMLANSWLSLTILLPIGAVIYYLILIDRPMRTQQEIARLTSERINLIADIIAGKEDIVDILDIYPNQVAEEVFTYGMIIHSEKQGIMEVNDASTLNEDAKVAAERLYLKIKDDGTAL